MLACSWRSRHVACLCDCSRASGRMIASYIGVEVSSEVSVPLAQKQSLQGSFHAQCQHACAFERPMVAMPPRLVAWSMVAWFPRSEASASGAQFVHTHPPKACSLSMERALSCYWEYLQRSLIHIIVDSCCTGELYLGLCLIRWGCRWLVRVRTTRWCRQAAHVPHARQPNDASRAF